MKTGLDREIGNPENYKLSIFYYNPKDKRIIVPKQDKYRGWTVNFGNRYACIVLLSVFLIILIFYLLN